MRNLKKPKIYVIKIFLLILTVIFFNEIFADDLNNTESKVIKDEITDNVTETFGLDDFVSSIDKYAKENGIEDIDFNDVASSLLKNNNLDYKGIISKIVVLFAKEVVGALKGAVSIFIIVIIMAIVSSLQLDKNSDVTKLAKLACFISIITITIATFLDVISMFRNVVSTLTTIMQTVSPFLMAILISTGAITTTGIIQPMLLFVASAIGFIVNYIIIPFFTIAVAFNVISSISENLKFDKMSNMFSSSALWIVGVVLTLFLGVLSLETNLTTSVDSLTVKTTQAAVSNFVPVVGKFFSDSFETVLGASKIIGNVGGTLGIIAIIIIACVPIIKILSVMVIYMILASIIEPIYADKDIIKYISGFANVYKNLLGILIGITILFVISTGLILNLVSSVIK